MSATDQPPTPPAGHGSTPPEPGPGPLGWLELTVEIMRDRSHSSWMLLHDEELLGALRERGAVAAYLPGAELATPDLVQLRLAVSPDGKVALAREGGVPEPGPPVEEFVPSLLDELRTVCFIPGEGPVGPPWLPVEEIVGEGRQPGPDSRVVYCYKGEEFVVATSLARDLDTPMTVYREDGWVVSASRHQPTKVLIGPPRRLTGAFPFAALDRRGATRHFVYVASPKDEALSVTVSWQPTMRTVEDEGQHPDAVELARWLASPRAWQERALATGSMGPDTGSTRPELEPELPPGMSLEQHQVLERWMREEDDASGFLPQAATVFGLPELAARLVEAGPDDVDPGGGRVIEPARGVDFMATALSDLDGEPAGSMPWTALSRGLWRRPWVGVALGAGELLVAVVLAALLVTGSVQGWWMWVVAVVFALGGFAHLLSGMFRLRVRGVAATGHGRR